MRNKPDDRRDNADKIQYFIDKTIENCELANEMISETSDEKMKNALREKNQRRKESLKGMSEELKDEIEDKNNGYM